MTRGDSQSEVHAQILADALDEGIIRRVDGDDNPSQAVYVPAASQARIRQFVSARVPTLRFGSGTTGIINARLRSIQNALLGTVNMQRSNVGTAVNAPGADGGLVPLFLQPTELELETIGCPLLSFAQEFFVDFDTGTSVDNIYSVVGITHDFGATGQFRSTIKLINHDAYGEFRTIASAIQAELAKATAVSP
jgi:hypothetical protein